MKTSARESPANDLTKFTTIEGGWQIYKGEVHESLEDPGLYVVEDAFWTGALSLLMALSNVWEEDRELQQAAHVLTSSIRREVIDRMHLIGAQMKERMKEATDK